MLRMRTRAHMADKSRDIAPCAGRSKPVGGALPSRSRVRSFTRPHPIHAYSLDGARRFEGQHPVHCPDARRLSLAWHRIWFGSLRWCPIRPLESAAGPASPEPKYLSAPRYARRHSLDRDLGWPCKLERGQGDPVPRDSWRGNGSPGGPRGNGVGWRLWKDLRDSEGKSCVPRY